jgi:hypothetical protein
MKALMSIMISISLLMLTACSAFRPSTQMINLRCSEPDAICTVNGQRYTAPASISVNRNRDVSIQCYKEGYVPSIRTIGNHLSTAAVLDIVGTVLILVPAVGLLTPGAWDLDETNVSMQLYPFK